MVKLQIVGSLGKDATVKEVNGQNVINFSVASTEKWKDKHGNQQERTTWVDCNYWVKSTALSPYLTKGVKVYVEGHPESRAFINKESQAVGILCCRVDSLELLTRSNVTESVKAEVVGGNPANESSDDLPF